MPLGVFLESHVTVCCALLPPALAMSMLQLWLPWALCAEGSTPGPTLFSPLPHGLPGTQDCVFPSLKLPESSPTSDAGCRGTGWQVEPGFVVAVGKDDKHKLGPPSFPPCPPAVKES